MKLRLRFSLGSMLLLVGFVGVVAGLRAQANSRNSQAIMTLRDLGGQLDLPPSSLSSWLIGSSTPLEEVSFLGPQVGDEAIDDIIEANSVLNVNRLVFTETRLSTNGEQLLRRKLPSVEIEVITPVFVPINAPPLQR